MKPQYFDRDLSWLTFNRRVLDEAANPQVPLMERINFLSIYSSNLDEFYRVRMPVLRALKKISEKDSNDIDATAQESLLQQASDTILKHQIEYGRILREELIPQLKNHDISLIYNEELPASLSTAAKDYFLTEILAFLQPVLLDNKSKFFPENNKLYFLVEIAPETDAESELFILNIPSEEVSRFFSLKQSNKQIICFLDDIIRSNLQKIFPHHSVLNCFSIKITRDAELDLDDEYPGDLSEQIEKQLNKRDQGFATRFLYDAAMPLRLLQAVSSHFDLTNATSVEGGRYHNLKDLAALPVTAPELSYEKWAPVKSKEINNKEPLAAIIAKRDLLVSPPYQSYSTILRFFNEAAVNPDVKEISVTLYRVASNSRIVNALISAAKSGKKVRVVVELKARFDEANNLKWAKKMKQAGVDIVYSVTALKVHAKIALVKTKAGDRYTYTGLLATGNLNEGTARFYTDHILLTANSALLREIELLFIFLARREKPGEKNQIPFKHLLVAGFNLQQRFLELLDREIDFAKQGLPAAATIKLNNLEEKLMINKLYEASQAGVVIKLIIRGICRLVPGIAGMSENISVKRIVDRYLEHGRVFIFNNNGNHELFMGSADWMNRNIYHRIEVCFPVYDETIKQEIEDIINLQLQDNVQAVLIDSNLNQIKPPQNGEHVQSQRAIYNYLKEKH